MKPIFAAGKNVLPSKDTMWLEALHKNNIAGRTIVPHSFLNRVFIKKGQQPSINNFDYDHIPERIANLSPLLEGTVFAVNEQGKPLKSVLAARCLFDGIEKEIIFRPDKEYAGRRNILLTCDHGFKRGKPNIYFVNEGNGELITTKKGMIDAPIVLMKFNGQLVQETKIKGRQAELIEIEPGVKVYSWISDRAAIGLTGRSHCVGGYDPAVYVSDPSDARHIVLTFV